MADAAPPTTSPEHAATPRVGVAGWVRGLLARATEPDVRHAAALSIVVVIIVFAAGRLPLRGDFELDLRAGDAVGGWSQVTLVGFSVNRPFGRFIPDQPGRTDLRIISNRPLPERFELELSAWTLRPGHPVELGATLGDETRTQRFGADETTGRFRFTNASGAREIELSLAEGDKLAIERIAVRDTGGRSVPGELP